MRKTMQVKELIDKVNKINQVSTIIPAEARKGINYFLESVLHDCGVYAGFGYLSRKEVPQGEQPGVVWTNEDKTVWSDNHDPVSAPNPTFPDETRRCYYYHRKLKVKL